MVGVGRWRWKLEGSHLDWGSCLRMVFWDRESRLIGIGRDGWDEEFIYMFEQSFWYVSGVGWEGGTHVLQCVSYVSGVGCNGMGGSFDCLQFCGVDGGLWWETRLLGDMLECVGLLSLFLHVHGLRAGCLYR